MYKLLSSSADAKTSVCWMIQNLFWHTTRAVYCVYHAMLRRARYCYIRRPSVCLSVCDINHDHIASTFVKIIAITLAWGLRCGVAKNHRSAVKGSARNSRWNRGGVHVWGKNLISARKIGILKRSMIKTEKIAYGLSFGTKIDEFEWP